MRAWPVSEPCLARESCRRLRSFTREAATAVAPSPENAKTVLSSSIITGRKTRRLRNHDAPESDFSPDRAGGYQLPADQPHPPPAGHPVHRLVQQDRAAADSRRLDRAVAAILRARPQRGQEDRIPQHARLLRARAQGGA